MRPAPYARDDHSASKATEGAEMTTRVDRIHTAEPYDIVKTSGRRVGDAGRTGEIVAVLGEEDHEHYRVRWEDGHESILYPGEGVTVEPSLGAVACAD
jgi:Domain of unknown function (DUF1918)